MNTICQGRPDHTQYVGHLPEIALEPQIDAVNRHGIQTCRYHEKEGLFVHVTDIDQTGVSRQDTRRGDHRVEGDVKIEGQDIHGTERHDPDRQGSALHPLHHFPYRPVTTKHCYEVYFISKPLHQMGGMSGITGIENSKGYAVPLEELDYLGQMEVEEEAPSRFGIDDEDRNEFAEDAR